MALSLVSLAGFMVLAVSSVLPSTGAEDAPAVQKLPVPQPVIYVPQPAPEPQQPVAPKPAPETEQQSGNTPMPNCRVGMIVMVPDGREGRVASSDGDTCSVLAYGEAYLSLWNADMVEPVYPQQLPSHAFGH